MLTVYLCFLAGGVVFPFISFIFGFLNNDVDTDLNADPGADADLGTDTAMDMGADMDTEADTAIPEINAPTDTGSIVSFGLIPTSLMSVSSLAITFGAVGGVMTFAGAGKIITFAVSVFAGYLASVVVQTIIKSLKKAQTRSYGINENELLLYEGTVVDTILPGQLGSVSFVTLKNVRVTYPAKCVSEGLRLETGRVVKAVEIKNGVFVVEPKNKYE